jgi:hypothetical protein
MLGADERDTGNNLTLVKPRDVLEVVLDKVGWFVLAENEGESTLRTIVVAPLVFSVGV